MSSAYLLENLSFGYDETPVLTIDRFEITRGEIVALVGPNGSGKTTLLKQLSFVERPDSGTISFFGERSTPANLIAFRRRVGFLLQHPYLFHTSVLSNITWPLRIRGISGDQAGEMAINPIVFEGRYFFNYALNNRPREGDVIGVAIHEGHMFSIRGHVQRVAT